MNIDIAIKEGPLAHQVITASHSLGIEDRYRGDCKLFMSNRAYRKAVAQGKQIYENGNSSGLVAQSNLTRLKFISVEIRHNIVQVTDELR